MDAGSVCACGEQAVTQCLDCGQALCEEDTCSGCQRCENDCLCHLRWWIPDFYL